LKFGLRSARGYAFSFFSISFEKICGLPLLFGVLIGPPKREVERPMRFLNGQRLYLRPIEESDLERCQIWANDPIIRKNTLISFPYDAKAERAWWKSIPRERPRTKINLALVLEDGDRHIGNVGIFRIDWVNRRAASGTIIGERDCWGKGYATESKRVILEFCFYELGLRRMESEVLSFNEPSIRHLLANGYIEEGRRPQAILKNGRWWDELLFGVTEEAFKTSKSYRSAHD